MVMLAPAASWNLIAPVANHARIGEVLVQFCRMSGVNEMVATPQEILIPSPRPRGEG